MIADSGVKIHWPKWQAITRLYCATTATTILWKLYRTSYISQRIILESPNEVSLPLYIPFYGNQCIQIREMLEFSSTVLSTLSPYLLRCSNIKSRSCLLILAYYYYTHLTASFPGPAGTWKVNQSGFKWSKTGWDFGMALASAGPYANNLQLAPHR